MSVDSAHKSRWVIAEVVFGFPFLLSLKINFMAPLTLAVGTFRIGFLAVGIVLVIIGFVLVVLARREFNHFHQPTDLGHPTSKVIISGVFAISRNPLYLASIFIILGLALALNILWAVVMLLVSIIICNYFLIIPEERYLAAKFGSEYQEYTASVHRWFGRK